MITKTNSRDVNVNWEEVNKATEIRRTYLIKDKNGKEFFKMYKPSEAKAIFREKGWAGQLIGIENRR